MTPTHEAMSWGRVARVAHVALSAHQRDTALPLPPDAGMSMLPFGNGRSYGDSNLNPGGALVLTHGLDRFMAFDRTTGVLRCEAGVLLSTILKLVVPQGWFLPVTPGTQYVTVGGAIANDVHGKNHHVAGSFGNHVRCFELLRSDGSRRVCSPTTHTDWFGATIGGLGLTGLITWAELQLRPIANAWMATETVRFHGLDDFFALSAESEREHEHTVAWIDCASGGAKLGRGLFSRANHAPAVLDDEALSRLPAGAAGATRRMPLTPPVSMVNSWSLKAFNTLYFHRQHGERMHALQHYRPFFYPLDAIREWNRMYGPKGFYQYQCVVPQGDAPAVTRALLQAIARSGMGSFLAVLKQFGAVASPGWLSFPMPGTTLALDFPNQGEPLMRLFAELDAIVREAGGRLYPAKDGRLPAAMFQTGHPDWERFLPYLDPRFSSGLWRRVAQPVRP